MSSFIKRLMGGNLWKKNPQENKGYSLPAELYQDLSLPLSVFRRCLKEDLSGLVLRGNPSPEEIAIAWASIYAQFIDLNSDNDNLYILQLQVDITLLKGHIDEVETALYFLKDTYHEGLTGILLSNGYNPPSREAFEESDKTRYQNQLAIIQNRLARKNLDLQTKQKEYEEYMASKSEDDVEDKYFTKTLLRLAKYQGVAIIKDTAISVEEFVLLLKDYLAFIASHKKDLDGYER